MSMCALALAGCALGDGSSGSGRPRNETGDTRRTVTLRFASADPGVVATVFTKELARLSGGRVRVEAVHYAEAVDGDERIARDLTAGRLDVADVAARAWESLGVMGFRAFQSPFLITSDALADRVTSDPRLAQAVLGSLAPIGATGLALTPRGVRYLLTVKTSLDEPSSFQGARIDVDESPTTTAILTALGARPTHTGRDAAAVTAALRGGDLDAVETDIPLAARLGYAGDAPRLSPPLFANVSTLVANSRVLRTLGPAATGWVRAAAELAASVQRALDDRSSWARACRAGLQVAPTSSARLDVLHLALAATHANLDGDPASALAIDRIGLLATQAPRIDAWAHCEGDVSTASSPTAAIDGTYEVAITTADTARAAIPPDNAGDYRFRIAGGRFAILHVSDPPLPTWPGWDFARDPVEVGTVLMRGDEALVRPETAIAVGSRPRTFRFELFRDRLRWRYVRGDDDPVWNSHPWRRVR